MGVIERSDHGATAILRICRPQKKNALRLEDFDELSDALVTADHDHAVRVIVVTGSEDSFSAGADLKSLANYERNPLAHLARVHRCARTLAAVAKPTIAAMNGVAVGAGLNLALACDLAIAGQSVMVSEIFLDRGLTLDYGGSALLVQRIGLHRAKELAFFASRLVGEELLAWGLVNSVVEDDQVLPTALDWADRLVDRSPTALALTKSLLNRAAASLTQAIDLEIIAQVAALSDPSIDSTLTNF
ncbi:enoyl-CoA hydratase-related protein [Ferrimicrobium sp.]|uniref:enoyl-CoA hydratase/isomerase family protein n=1 Tax=Ferrimicrobium sp. TaxID=2926050 RepID=UPI002636C465|nr:enoyl-CoA hydratase-related protein [Ferrimicrobium sp.]